MPFLTAGYPDRETFVKLLLCLQENGADLIEVGVPFSDPMADGKTIQMSSQKALEQDISLSVTLDILSQLKGELSIPVIIMSYYNPVYHFGEREYFSRAREIGVAGTIIPDIIPEEGEHLEELSKASGIDLIYLLAPTSQTERQKEILKRGAGFIYLVSVAGVTGTRTAIPLQISDWISDIKKQSPVPVCVGFGIADAEQAKAISRNADGVIIGSAIIDIIGKSSTPERALAGVRDFITEVRKEMDNDHRNNDC